VANTERSGRFYSPWPVQGAKLSKQWDNLRVNHEETKAVVRGSLLDVNTDNDYFDQERALRGHEYGQNDASKKFRWVYSATDGKFRMQRNDGTQATPSWTDLLVADTSGTLLEINPSLSNDLDMNGNDILQVQNINTNLINSENWQPRFEVTDSNLDNIFYTVRRITFDRESGFYVTGDSNAEPIVSSNVSFGKSRKYTKASSKEWIVEHGFGVVPQHVQVYDDAQRLVIPNVADTSNPNVAYFYFTNAMSGHAIISTGGLGGNEVRPLLANTAVQLNGNTKDLTMDWADGSTFFLPIRRPMTIHTPLNLPTPSGAQTINLISKNDGFYNFNWSSKYIFKGGGQLSPTQAVGAVDLWSMVYHHILDKIIVARLDNCFY
jgi:hypothetical protein